MKITQHQKVLALLSDGEWHRSDEFLYGLHLSQFHARIKELVEQKGYKIETGYFENEWNYKSYRLTCTSPMNGLKAAQSRHTPVTPIALSSSEPATTPTKSDSMNSPLSLFPDMKPSESLGLSGFYDL